MTVLCQVAILVADRDNCGAPACQIPCERETSGPEIETQLWRFSGEAVPKMRLTKQTGHAIRILIDCAQSEMTLIKVAEISDRLDITKQNVFKIVHILSRAGFIAAVRGPSGGVRLAKPAQDIRIGDVVRAIEVTDMEIDGEHDDALARPQGQASIKHVFDDALMAFVSVLDQHTLADLVQQKLTPTKRAAASPSSKRPKPAPGKKNAGSPRR